MAPTRKKSARLAATATPPAKPPTKKMTKAAKKAKEMQKTIKEGRWTASEHDLFLEGLEKHGRSWKKVADHIGTRTVMQTRTHAQKYFDKQKEEQEKKSPIKKTPETSNEHAAESPKPKPGTAAPQSQPTASPVQQQQQHQAMMMMGSNQMFQHQQMMLTAAAKNQSLPDDLKSMDIVLPTASEAIAGRPANREYIRVLQANCALYHSLPMSDQVWMLRNICHFLTEVRGRSMTVYHPYMGYRTTKEPPVGMLQTELALDTFKRAASFHYRYWLLGDTHGATFLHRKADGGWQAASVEDVRKILDAEGGKNLLLLPEGVENGPAEETEEEQIVDTPAKVDETASV